MTKNALNILEEVFGYKSFRPQQEKIINAVLNKTDSVVLMPTGGGKSLCFQIPALMQDGITLVISPLISLMKDQVEALKANGVSAAYLNSTVDEEERLDIIKRSKSNEIKLLYLSPETLVTVLSGFILDLDISIVAIDEAHCVSMWGHDFRPEYTQLSTFRNSLPDATFIALTATADKLTRKDIANHLGLKSPEVFVSSFDRPNLSLTVRGNIPKKKKITEVVDFISDRLDESGIIYCLSRKETESWSEILTENGIRAAHYHAGLPAEERAKVQEDFINDTIPIICATIAFGMGIDKSNVRWIIHNNLPKNVEGYYQEIGRAGRDGLASDTLLYYNMRDVVLLAQFAQDSSQKEVLIEKLNRMKEYAQATTCRRKILLAYFSEQLTNNCNNCDVCKNPPASFNGEIIAQKALSAAARTKETLSARMTVDVLRGAKTMEIFSRGLNKVKTYGAGREYSLDEWNHYITQCINMGLFEVAYDENMHLKITEFGKDILYGKKRIYLTKPTLTDTIRKEKKKSITTLSSDENLFNQLKLLRRKIAVEDNVPAYIVFSDATLLELSKEKPTTQNALLAISGVGLKKAETYGEEFLAAIIEFKKTAKPKKKVNTIDITATLLNQNLSVEQIAEERNLSATTVYSHIATLLNNNKDMDYKAFISESDLTKMNKAFEEIQEENQLKPYFEYFNGEVEYHKIRIALAILTR
ncbi:MAG: DNA helicase RecQ [Lishizhenia sp.]